MGPSHPGWVMCWPLLLYHTRQSKYWNPANNHACYIFSSLPVLFSSSLSPKDCFLELFTKTGLFLRDNIEEERWIEGRTCYFRYSWTTEMGGRGSSWKDLKSRKRDVCIWNYTTGPIPVDSQDPRLWFSPEAHQQRDTGLGLQALPPTSLPARGLLSMVTLIQSPFNLLPALPCFGHCFLNYVLPFCLLNLEIKQTTWSRTYWFQKWPLLHHRVDKHRI